MYALTISPPHRKDVKYWEQYEVDSDVIRRYLNQVSDHYIMYPEIATEGRLHYHGTIKLKDPVKWYKSIRATLNSILGFTCLKKLKTLQDVIKWNYYASKDWPITSQVLQHKIRSINKGIRTTINVSYHPVIYKSMKNHKKHIKQLGINDSGVENSILDYI